MRANQVEAALRELAPYNLAYEGEELGCIYGDADREIDSIGVTWRPTVSVLRECVQRRIGLLVIHEPLLQSKKSSVIPPSRLTYPPNQVRESLLTEGNIVVLRAHSNWDDAPGGNNDTLAQALGMQVRTKIPYGRVGSVARCSLQDFVAEVKQRLGCPHVLVVGDPQREVLGVAVVSGSGNSLTEMIEVSKQEGADVLVSGDIQDSRARFATELGLALVDAGGYYTETPGMRNLASLLQSRLSQVPVEYLDPGPPWWFD